MASRDVEIPAVTYLEYLVGVGIPWLHVRMRRLEALLHSTRQEETAASAFG